MTDSFSAHELLEGILFHFERAYLFPSVAASTAESMRAALAAGGYDADDLSMLCAQLTTDLRRFSNDKHLRLICHATPQAERASAFTDADWLAAYRAEGAYANYGFRKAERLPGNIGLIVMDEFYEPHLAGPVAASVFAFLERTAALLLDLRDNGGGEPSMVALMCSYFLGPDPVLLNTIEMPLQGKTQQFWNVPHLAGPRYLDRPVFVLTSGRTFSAAEECAYNLQTLGRATIIGEMTGGGAHPVERFQVTPYVDVQVPVERSVNPITGTNWEGVGVRPDVVVAATDAFDEAYRRALQHAADQYRNDPAAEAALYQAEQALASLR